MGRKKLMRYFLIERWLQYQKLGSSKLDEVLQLLGVELSVLVPQFTYHGARRAFFTIIVVSEFLMKASPWWHMATIGVALVRDPYGAPWRTLR